MGMENLLNSTSIYGQTIDTSKSLFVDPGLNLKVESSPESKDLSSELEDSYTPSQNDTQSKLEERMNQVISPDEMKNLLSLLMRLPANLSQGNLVDLKA